MNKKDDSEPKKGKPDPNTEDCPLLRVITEEHTPELLRQLESMEYVVKGGKACDYYITQQCEQKPAWNTDWDIACKDDSTKSAISKRANNVVLSIPERPSLILTNITTLDKKKGTQLGINCGKYTNYFLDIVVYSDGDEVYDNFTTEGGIKYVSKEYLLKDLHECYQDRIEQLRRGFINIGSFN